MKKKVRTGILALPSRLLSSKIFMSSALISITSVAGGLVNFLFNVIAARILGQEKFGIVYPLTSLFMIISLPAMALQYVVSRDVSFMIKRKDWRGLKKFVFEVTRVILVFMLALLALLLLVLPTVKSFLNIDNSSALLLTYLLIPLAVSAVPFVSLVQSRERFGTYSIYFIVGIMVKFLAGVSLIYYTNHYFGVLIGLFAGQIFSFGIIVLDFLRFKELKKFPLAKIREKVLDLRKFSRSFYYALISVGAFYLITYLDSVLVRHFIPESSGVYSIVNLIGKASFFLATAVSFVMLPQLAKDRKNMRKNNFKAFLFLVTILLAYATALWISSGFLAETVFAGKYPGMENILPLYAFMFIPFAIISYFVNYYVIAEKILYPLAILGGAVVQTFGIYYFHQDLVQVSLVVGASGLIILAILVFDLVKNAPKRIPPNDGGVSV